MLSFNKYVNEIEYLLILLALIAPLIYLLCYKVLRGQADEREAFATCFIPQEASVILKGICCILIPLHHYGIFFCETRFVNIIRLGGGNIALVVFLLLSAYGVLKSERKRPLVFGHYLKKRILKIYNPFLCITALAVFMAIFIGAQEVSSTPTNMSDDLVAIAKEKSPINLLLMATGIIEIDSSMWFVWVTLVGYVVFFCCKSIYNIDHDKKRFLFAYTSLIILYGLLCRFVIGTPIHYYRNLWALVLGTMIALYEKELLQDKAKFLLLIAATIGYVWMQIILLKESTYFIHAVLGLTLIMLISLAVETKSVTVTKWMATLSAMSYYVYICHEKFFAFLNYYFGKTNVLFPLLFILLFSFIYLKIANSIKWIK